MSANDWLDAYYKADTEIQGYYKDIVSYENAIAQKPYDYINEDIERLETIKSNYESLNNISETRGVDKTVSQLKKDNTIINDQIDIYIEERKKKWEDYNKALSSSDGVYGGKKAQEILNEYYEIDTKINNLREDIIQNNNEMANIPFENLQKELDLLDALKSNYESLLDIEETRGAKKTVYDYQKLIDYNNQQISVNVQERNEAYANYQKALTEKDSVYGGKTSDEWLQEYYEYDTEINNLTKDTIEYNNAILNMPIDRIEEALELIENMRSNFESILAIQDEMGIDRSKNDYMKQIEYSNKQLEQYQQERDIAWNNYQNALRENDNTYAGYDAEYWRNEYYKLDTEVNNAKKDIVEANNAIAQMPYDAIDKAIDKIQSFADYYSSAFDLKSKLGYDLEENDYLGKIKNNYEQINKYTEEQQQAYADYLLALADPNEVYGGKSADEYLQMYYEAGTQINNLKSDNEDLKDSLRDDVYWRTFERAHDSAQRFGDILSSVEGLIDDDMMFDKNGKLTDFGVSKIANLTSQYENARKEVQNYSNDIENLNDLYMSGYYTQEEYNDKLAEFQKSMLDSASSMKSYIDEIKDTYKEMEQSELDNLLKLIDLRNEALTAKKNYYDWDKTLKDKNKDIQALQAQISALEGIDTAEAKAKQASLQADLQDKQDELNDAIQEHMFELSQDSLDELKTTLQDAFDDRWENLSLNLDEIKKLMESANELTQSSTATIEETLNSLLEYYGINPDVSGIRGYASGTKRVDKDKIAWTSENGNEVVIRPSDGAVLTKLKQGDIIPNADLSKNLFEWGAINPDMFKLDVMKSMPEVSSNTGSVSITNSYDSLLTVQGNVDKDALPELKEILKQSYEYTTQQITKDARKVGLKV